MPTRRNALQTGSLTLAALLTGRVERVPFGSRQDATPGDSPDKEDETDPAAESPDQAVAEYDVALDWPLVLDEPALLFTSREGIVAATAFDEDVAERRAFIDRTDFEDSVLLYVESKAPQACYGLVVDDAEANDERLLVTACATRTTEERQLCADVISRPSGLIRVTFAETVASSATVMMTDGWGETTITPTRRFRQGTDGRRPEREEPSETPFPYHSLPIEVSIRSRHPENAPKTAVKISVSIRRLTVESARTPC